MSSNGSQVSRGSVSAVLGPSMICAPQGRQGGKSSEGGEKRGEYGSYSGEDEGGRCKGEGERDATSITSAFSEELLKRNDVTELRAGSWIDLVAGLDLDAGSEEGGGPSSSSISESTLERGEDSSDTSEHGTWTP
jgi:hypothetical protein